MIQIQPGNPVELSTIQHAGYEFRYPPLDILLICDDGHPASVVTDHIQAFKQYSRHRYVVANPHRNEGRLALSAAFDAIVIHYSIAVLSDGFLPQPYREVIAAFPGLKVQFIQDEYRWINPTIERMKALGIHVLFSALRPHTARAVYCERAGLPDFFIFSNLPGFVPEYLRFTVPRPIRGRPLHATYRAREVPYWLGRHSREKQEMAHAFQAVADKHGLRVDISAREDDRVYGHDWIELILSGKAVLGTEGGASIFDFDCEAERKTREYLGTHPGAGFEEVHRNVLAQYEGNIVHRAFTPRLLEAIALRTALVLFPSEYAGILQPDRDYIPLERDLSNAAEVVARLRDDAFLQNMVDETYDRVIRSGEFSFSTFVSRFDTAIDLALRGVATKQGVDRGGNPMPLSIRNTIGIQLRIKQEKFRLKRALARIMQLLVKNSLARRIYGALRGRMA